MTRARAVSLARRGMVILAGHALGSLSVVPTVILLGWIVERAGPTPLDLLDPDIFGVAATAAVLVFLATLPPAGMAVALAETRGIRHWAYFASAGGLTALLLLGLLGLLPRPGGAAIGGFLSAFMVGAGLVAGLVYWAVAGRRSGALRTPGRQAP